MWERASYMRLFWKKDYWWRLIFDPEKKKLVGTFGLLSNPRPGLYPSPIVRDDRSAAMGRILLDASSRSLHRSRRHVGVFGLLGIGDCEHDRRESFEEAEADLYLQFHTVGYHRVRFFPHFFSIYFLSFPFFSIEILKAHAVASQGGVQKKKKKKKKSPDEFGNNDQVNIVSITAPLQSKQSQASSPKQTADSVITAASIASGNRRDDMERASAPRGSMPKRRRLCCRMLMGRSLFRIFLWRPFFFKKILFDVDGLE